MYEDLSDNVRRVLMLAHGQARRFNHPYIGTEHLLLGLLDEGSGAAAKVLGSHGLSLAQVQEKVHFILGEGDPQNGASLGVSAQVANALTASGQEAAQMGDDTVDSGHLLLALLGQSPDLGLDILLSFGLDREGLRAETAEALARVTRPRAKQEETEAALAAFETNPGGPPAGPRIAVGSQVLDRFGTDLTRRAADGELSPVVTRDDEIARLTEALCRRIKSNPVLVGDPGVGKTAIVEGLAQKIVAGAVPARLRGKTLFSLDLSAIVAGSRYRGDFEEKMREVLGEVSGRDDIVLFVDEIHTLVGAGGGEGSIDAAHMLKPMLARGEIQLIGATTFGEYRKYLERDAALERRLQPIEIAELSVERTMEVLEALRPGFEAYHGVRIAGSAQTAAATLAKRYIADRLLPDKAIDLIDQAAARASLSGAGPKEVREENIAEIVSGLTGVPLTTLTESESAKILRMEAELHRRVVGMDHVIESVTRSVRRMRARLKTPGRPAGSFIFAGPTGVGKTELAKALGEFLFDDRDGLIRFDMSEFGEAFSSSRLVGSPPGYVGYDDGGELTEAVRRRPFSVLLFDEIEKAHGDVFNLLLQVLEDGHLTDSHGRAVDFTNCIVILTTNLGSREIAGRSVGFGPESEAETDTRSKSMVIHELKSHFRPEFLNRFDDILVFPRLTREEVLQIVDRRAADLRARLGELGIALEMTSAARKYLAAKGFDRELGARPLRRLMEREVEDVIAEMLLRGELTRGATVQVETDPDSRALRIRPGIRT